MAGLGRQQFAALYGTSEEELVPYVRSFFDNATLVFFELSDREQREVIEDVRREVSDKDFDRSGPAKRDSWDASWKELARDVSENRFTPENLSPKYYRGDYKRLEKRFVRVASGDFEREMNLLIRAQIFDTFMKGFSNAYEFGCGSGHSALQLQQMQADISVTACDWSPSALTLVDSFAESEGVQIATQLFDMFSPSDALSVSKSSIAYTFHALEQLGSNWSAFLSFLLRKGFSQVVHLEPIAEFYDPSDTLDRMALEYHQKRAYLDGFFSQLKELEQGGEIAIEHAHRIPFGSRYHEAYSLVVWRPV